MKLIKVVLAVIAGSLFCGDRKNLDASPLDVTFVNSARITIPSVGCANPYPSTISVKNLAGIVSDVSVTLSNLSHSYPDDLDVFLLTPASRRVVLMSDAGGGFNVTNAVLTFRSSAANKLPDCGPIVSGTFLPTDYDVCETFASQAPGGRHSSSLAALNGSNPNGNWSLYVIDDLKRDSGAIACGWQLAFTLTLPPAITTQPASRTVIAGDAVGFSVVAIGTPPLSYQWRKEGVAIPGATGSSLLFSNVSLGHSGSYSVTIANSAGSIESAPASLTVLTSTVRINEWMALNANTVRDEDGDASDWIELYNPNSSPVLLSGWYLTDNLSNPTRWKIPDGVVIAPGGFLLVWADGKNRPNHTDFLLSSVGEAIGIATPNGVLRDSVTFGGQYEDISQGRFPNGTGPTYFMSAPTPGAPNQLAQIVATVEIPVSERGATWKYLDTGANQGTAWRSNFFNDTGWPSGAAELGFGDFDEATIINGGPVTNRHVTTYFRRAFTVGDPSYYTNIALRLLRDDGAVVYLNGLEIFRSNMPTGQVGFATFAATAVEGAAESSFVTRTFEPGLLQAGLNVLAVEVHQVDRNSPDLSFDLELLGSGPLLPGVTTAPTSVTVPAGSSITLRAERQGGPFRYRWLLNETPLPGATNATFHISGVELNNAGAYTVLITDPSGRTSILGPMDLILSAPAVPDLADSFSQNMGLVGMTGSVQGSSTLASRENLEPFHAGNVGSRSVWFTWSPPLSGIATFSTRGSTFDTLLAIYQGNSFTNLSPVASDDDGGGLFTSLVQFNASTGSVYRIAVDGLNDAGGSFALNWALEPTADKIPAIQISPVSQSVPLGSAARFYVGVENTASTYQWFRDDLPIAGAINDNLIISDVQQSDLGRYFARVIDPSGRFIDTVSAELQIGNCAQVSTKYFSNLIPCPDLEVRPFAQLTSPRFSTANFNTANTNAASGGVPGSLGNGGWEYGEVVWGSQTGGTAAYDGTTLTAARTFIIEARDDGFLELDTCGTQFPVLLALYKNVSTRYLDTAANRIASDLDSASLGRPASIGVQVKRGFYRLAAAPLPDSGATLTDSNFRWSMRLGPSCFVVTQAVVHTLTVNTSAPPGTTFQWYRNGTSLPNYEQTLLVNIPPGQAGSYELVMINPSGGRQTNLVADIIIPDQYYFRRQFQLVREGDLLKFHIESRAGSPLVLETAMEVDPQLPLAWSPIATNRCIGYTDCDFAITFKRFFRLRPEIP